MREPNSQQRRERRHKFNKKRNRRIKAHRSTNAFLSQSDKAERVIYKQERKKR